MNHNMVNINGRSIQIHNPTLYSPDAIIEAYLKKNGIQIQTELAKAFNSGISLGKAAQDLFDRAVVYEVFEIEQQYELRYLGSNQKVVIKEAEIDIAHSTVYSPHAIIQKYVREQGIGKLAGVLKRTAVRELFTRVVRAEEHARYRTGFTQCTFGLACIKTLVDINNLVMGKSTFVEASFFIFLNFIIGGLIMGFVYDVVIYIAEKLGIKAQYSV